MYELKADSPIGIMDSGMGGISVLREIVKVMPQEKYIFFGDSAHAPYGSRSTEEIYQLTENVVQQLLDQKVKAIVVACNTASSAAGAKLRQEYPQLPIIAIEPALKPAVLTCSGGRIAVLATEATLREKKFACLMEDWQNRAEILKLPLPGLADFVERGELHTPALKSFLQSHLEKLGNKKIDAVVLGCTHYPFVQRALQELLGEDTKFFDGATGTARQLRRRLYSLQLLNHNSQGEIIWQNSSSDPAMIELSKKLFQIEL